MKNKAFKVVMSKGDNIEIDSDEVAKIIDAIKRSTVVRVRSGLFNSSYFVSIIEDVKRMERWWEDIKHLDRNDERRKEGPQLIRDIFEDLPLLNQQGIPQNPLRLDDSHNTG